MDLKLQSSYCASQDGGGFQSEGSEQWGKDSVSASKILFLDNYFYDSIKGRD